MEIKLTPIQEKYREAIAWLLHPYAIAQGKTFLLAVIWIDIAKNWPDNWFKVWDHRQGNQQLKYLIAQILQLEPNMMIQDSTIKWNGPKVQANYPTPGINPYLLKPNSTS